MYPGYGYRSYFALFVCLLKFKSPARNVWQSVANSSPRPNLPFPASCIDLDRIRDEAKSADWNRDADIPDTLGLKSCFHDSYFVIVIAVAVLWHSPAWRNLPVLKPMQFVHKKSDFSFVPIGDSPASRFPNRQCESLEGNGQNAPLRLGGFPAITFGLDQKTAGVHGECDCLSRSCRNRISGDLLKYGEKRTQRHSERANRKHKKPVTTLIRRTS